ncbi:hypothetical protein NQ315_013737 [Exocentrus adspersus]|uniref:Uncharacterized protein n=1 Tax=Exocentrus adspersus TaxID=1586481 RepID=A0AAV8W3Y4_9CUCU|nr:hypothetical protein NQ315_013737 [Exocentrus adspersus]
MLRLFKCRNTYSKVVENLILHLMISKSTSETRRLFFYNAFLPVKYRKLKKLSRTLAAKETLKATYPAGDNQSAPRRRRRQRKQPKTVVNPDSNFYFYWLLVITICVLYNLWTLIVRESFPELQGKLYLADSFPEPNSLVTLRATRE